MNINSDSFCISDIEDAYIIYGDISSYDDIIVDLDKPLLIDGSILTKGSISSNTSIHCRNSLRCEKIDVNGTLKVELINATVCAANSIEIVEDGDITFVQAGTISCLGSLYSSKNITANEVNTVKGLYCSDIIAAKVIVNGFVSISGNSDVSEFSRNDKKIHLEEYCSKNGKITTKFDRVSFITAFTDGQVEESIEED